MRSTSRTRFALGIVLALGLMLSIAAPAGAAGIIHCNISAVTTQSEISPGVYDWDIVMTGQCNGDGKGPYAAFGSADGTSTGLGLCDGSLLLQDLDLDVFLFLDSARAPQFSKLLHERWSAPVTTYPIATPFLIEDASSGALVGAGALFHHLLANCAGSPGSLILSVRVH